ncbi:MAG: CbiX/SirB N-terminal domain-containing protein [Gammaproteobacteria bacterium]|nr:CbiX/SirB N-terminal domain-containing protein [Gammaproteobacteria bacterium]
MLPPRTARVTSVALVVAAATLLVACSKAPAPANPNAGAKVGVLLVAHGSKSATWTGMVETLAKGLEASSAKLGVAGTKLAYITESKPSIADEMRAFDQEGYDEVVVTPLLIGNESERINTYVHYLAGIRSEARVIKQLKNEGYDIYYPRARVSLTPALSESDALKKNILRRVLALKGEGSGEDLGVVLVGYGDKVFGQQMEGYMTAIGRYLKIKSDIDTVAFAFCGNLVDYSGEPVVKVINEVLELEDEVLVVPVLLGVDEMLQTNTIQAAINAIPTSSKVRYQPDAVLPDPEVTEWLGEKIAEAVQRSRGAGADAVDAPNRSCKPDC